MWLVCSLLALRADAVAYDYGESACIFASNTSCAPVYANIFSKSLDELDSLTAVFDAFGPVVSLQMVFLLLRTALAACHDFRFMAKAACLAFVCVYSPALFVSFYFLQTSVAYYCAMYLPHFILILIYGWRLRSHLRRLHNGEDGPWTPYSSA